MDLLVVVPFVLGAIFAACFVLIWVGLTYRTWSGAFPGRAKADEGEGRMFQ